MKQPSEGRAIPHTSEQPPLSRREDDVADDSEVVFSIQYYVWFLNSGRLNSWKVEGMEWTVAIS